MDNVLKRRLIGASILIALAVIFLPMLLVGPEPDLDDRRLREPLAEMPDDDREIRRIPLDPDLARVPPSRVEREASPASREAGDAPTGETQAPVGQSAIAAADAPTRDPAADEGSDERRPSQPEEIVLNPTNSNASPTQVSAADETSAAPTAGENADEDSLARPLTEPPSSPVRSSTGSVPPAGDGNWVVQVASFGSQESSQSTRDRLEALGHPVITDEVVRGDTMLYRLRTGPYADRGLAETARGQIAATVAGVDPIVREVSDAALTSTPGFAVQVGSFASEENAERETARLRTLGFEAFRLSEDASGRSIWKVLVGTVDERAAADALQARLADEAGVEGLVVSHP